jgi:hypothetical protein
VRAWPVGNDGWRAETFRTRATPRSRENGMGATGRGDAVPADPGVGRLTARAARRPVLRGVCGSAAGKRRAALTDPARETGAWPAGAWRRKRGEPVRHQVQQPGSRRAEETVEVGIEPRGRNVTGRVAPIRRRGQPRELTRAGGVGRAPSERAVRFGDEAARTGGGPAAAERASREARATPGGGRGAITDRADRWRRGNARRLLGWSTR